MDGGFISALESHLSGKKATTLSEIKSFDYSIGTGEAAEELPRLVLESGPNRLDYSSSSTEYRVLDFRILIFASSKSSRKTVADAITAELRALAEKPSTLSGSMGVGADCSQLNIVDHTTARLTQLLWRDRFDVSCKLSIPRS